MAHVKKRNRHHAKRLAKKKKRIRNINKRKKDWHRKVKKGV